MLSVLPLLLAAAGFESPLGAGRVLLATEPAATVGFLENRGQTDARVAFYLSTAVDTTFVTRDGLIVHSLPSPGRPDSSRRTVIESMPARVRPSGRDRSSTCISVMHGSDASAWTTDVSAYERISFGEVWPGIRVALRARQRKVEKLFLLDPGASAAAIRVRVLGAGSLRVGRRGELIAGDGPEELAWSAPLAYQQIRGTKRPVPVSYRASGHEYGFVLGPHDLSAAVTIDPVLQATYLGGRANDYAYAVAVHPWTGEVLVAGRTESPNFPGVTAGPQNAAPGGLDDVFLERLSPDLTELRQATYFGGSGIDLAFAIAVNPVTGEIFIAGQTESADLPAASGGAQRSYSGQYDAFVARLDPLLSRIEQVTYLGGSGGDGAGAIAISSDGSEAIVAGYTFSQDFPGTEGGARPTMSSGFGYDAFVTRLDASLRFFRQSTYFGGTSSDEACAVAVDPMTGDVFVGGQTESTDLPNTVGAAQSDFAGSLKNGFVARFDPTLAVLRQSTYLGGSDYTNVLALAIHPRTGEIFVAGQTSSTDLPGSRAGAPSGYGARWNGFVARLDPELTNIASTYIGGSQVELTHALVIHPVSGDVYLAGETSSLDLPGTAGAAQTRFGGGFTDGFVARFDASLSLPGKATYLGGGDIDRIYAISVSPLSGEIMVAGETRSSPFPAARGGAQAVFGGGDLYGGDAFVARLTPELGSGVTRSRVQSIDRPHGSNPRTVPSR